MIEFILRGTTALSLALCAVAITSCGGSDAPAKEPDEDQPAAGAPGSGDKLEANGTIAYDANRVAVVPPRSEGRVMSVRADRAQIIRMQVAAAIAAYQTASTEVQVLESTGLSLARQKRRLVEVAYREGKVGLPELLRPRNQAIDAELEYWTAWLAERQAVYSLAEATGDNLTMDRAQP